MKYSFNNITILDIILVLLLLIILAILFFNIKKSENMDNIKNLLWKRNKCPYEMNSTLKKLLNNYNIKESSIPNSDLYFPCTYDDIDKEINDIPESNNINQKYFIFDGVDNMTAKDNLWTQILNYHGYEKTKTLLPISYILPDDIQKLKQNFDKNKIYIMKKNIQRQEGLKITNKLEEIINGAKDKYVIVQELLQDPYLIDGRKINMRFYVLITCHNQNTNIYVYNNGFMYYTKDKFIKNSLQEGPNITTGYIDRKVYEVNPLTHSDLKNYLDKKRDYNEVEKEILKNKNIISQVFFNNIYKLLQEVFTVFIGKICNNTKIYNNVKFQLFGVDIAINDKLEPMIMEINKGPDMGAKDERDGNVKYNCMRDIFNIIGILDIPDNNGFIKLINSK